MWPCTYLYLKQFVSKSAMCVDTMDSWLPSTYKAFLNLNTVSSLHVINQHTPPAQNHHIHLRNRTSQWHYLYVEAVTFARKTFSLTFDILVPRICARTWRDALSQQNLRRQQLIQGISPVWLASQVSCDICSKRHISFKGTNELSSFLLPVPYQQAFLSSCHDAG